MEPFAPEWGNRVAALSFRRPGQGFVGIDKVPIIAVDQVLRAPTSFFAARSGGSLSSAGHAGANAVNCVL